MDAGILCCVIGIIASIGSIISNLTRDGYTGRVKIKDTEIIIEKKDLKELHKEREEIHKERMEFRKEIDKLKEIVKEAEQKLNGNKN